MERDPKSVSTSLIDPLRHPLLHCVAQGAAWAGQDEFPGSVGADLLEGWLQFIACKGELGRFHHRLRTSTKEQRDETFTELGCAFFLERELGLPIIGWEPSGVAGTKGEFLVALPDGRQMFVEVKSPGWEAEITRTEPATVAAARLSQPKYPGVEAFFSGAEAPIVAAVKKAYRKFPDTTPTLLLIFDDERVPLAEMCLDDVLGALYEKHIPGEKDPADPTKDKEDGPFFDSRFGRLGAVGVLNYGYASRPGALHFLLFRNPHSTAAVAVPREAFPGRAVYDGLK